MTLHAVLTGTKSANGWIDFQVRGTHSLVCSRLVQVKLSITILLRPQGRRALLGTLLEIGGTSLPALSLRAKCPFHIHLFSIVALQPPE